jgi:hypothetical protein
MKRRERRHRTRLRIAPPLIQAATPRQASNEGGNQDPDATASNAATESDDSNIQTHNEQYPAEEGAVTTPRGPRAPKSTFTLRDELYLEAKPTNDTETQTRRYCPKNKQIAGLVLSESGRDIGGTFWDIPKPGLPIKGGHLSGGSIYPKSTEWLDNILAATPAIVSRCYRTIARVLARHHLPMLFKFLRTLDPL